MGVIPVRPFVWMTEHEREALRLQALRAVDLAISIATGRPAPRRRRLQLRSHALPVARVVQR